MHLRRIRREAPLAPLRLVYHTVVVHDGADRVGVLTHHLHALPDF